MKKIYLLLPALAFLSFLPACRSCGGPAEDPAHVRDAKAMLAEAGVDPETLYFKGNDAFVTYEASQALEYDHQLLVVWGSVFGVLAPIAPGTITIVNTAGGEPAVVVKAQSADIRAFHAGQIDVQEFRRRLQISPVED